MASLKWPLEVTRVQVSGISVQITPIMSFSNTGRTSSASLYMHHLQDFKTEDGKTVSVVARGHEQVDENRISSVECRRDLLVNVSEKKCHRNQASRFVLL